MTKLIGEHKKIAMLIVAGISTIFLTSCGGAAPTVADAFYGSLVGSDANCQFDEANSAETSCSMQLSWANHSTSVQNLKGYVIAADEVGSNPPKYFVANGSNVPQASASILTLTKYVNQTVNPGESSNFYVSFTLPNNSVLYEIYISPEININSENVNQNVRMPLVLCFNGSNSYSGQCH